MNLECPGKIRGESSREYATRLLRFNILNLNLKPGESISENEIANFLNISRTPVREAFIRLSQDQLIEIYPQRGTSVSKINLNFVEEGRFVRTTLEKALIKLVCENYVNDGLITNLEENIHMQEFNINIKNYLKIMQLDEEFHRIIFKACNKERTHSVIESLNYDFYRIRMFRITSSIRLDIVFAQHVDIKNAIKAKDALWAEKAMDEHLTSVKFDQEIVRQEYPEYFI